MSFESWSRDLIFLDHTIGAWLHQIYNFSRLVGESRYETNLAQFLINILKRKRITEKKIRTPTPLAPGHRHRDKAQEYYCRNTFARALRTQLLRLLKTLFFFTIMFHIWIFLESWKITDKGSNLQHLLLNWWKMSKILLNLFFFSFQLLYGLKN